MSGAKPSARVSGALVWDDKRKRLWLYAGNTSASGASYAPVGDLWSFDSWRDERPDRSACRRVDAAWCA
ncbi:MAG: hypothetical protein U0263_07420 [Polyangiaceae bacterium]